ncbi:MAG TPA: ABC transporter substrate-binding protein [Anaerolineales bacterium]|nr:ABC transporter substrate-binding protein [Anaerolineales bacterium]
MTRRTSSIRGGLAPAVAVGIGLALLSGCQTSSALSKTPSPVEVRVGYFPNITHSQALIGLARGDFATALGPGYTLVPTQFNAGPSVIEALFAGQIDLAYIGPNPAINGFVRSQGVALRVIAGATSGGAGLVARAGSRLAASDFEGAKIASPQLGNTQDIALRAYLIEHGLKSAEKGGTVEVVPVENPQILDLMRLGQIDGAWVPEPWTSRLIVEGGGALLIDERELWPGGQFSTAVVIVATPFLEAHPEAVRAWLSAHVAITLWEREHPSQATAIVNREIERLTGKALPPEVLSQAWSRLEPTYDPLYSTILGSAEHAYAVGYLTEPPLLAGLADLALLNEVLVGRGLPAVEAQDSP